MGRGGIGRSSCASALSGAAATSKKDRHLNAAGSLPTIALSLKCPLVRAPVRLPETAAELGRSSGRTAFVAKLVKTRGKRLPPRAAVLIVISFNDQ